MHTAALNVFDSWLIGWACIMGALLLGYLVEAFRRRAAGPRDRWHVV